MGLNKETDVHRPGPDSESSFWAETGPDEKRSGENTGPHPGLADTKNDDGSDLSPAELEDGKQQRHAHQTDDVDHDDETGDGDGVLSRVASRVITKVTTKSSFNPGPPPNGGLQAWTAVACTHIVVMNTWGIVNSFGLFQTHYTTSLSRPPSDISWIGSLQIFLLFFVGAVTGRLTDAGYFRPVFALGVALNLIGIFTASVATQYWHVVLAQGICMGLGNGCLFCPCISTVSTYFSTRRALAMGMAACGSATGGLVFPSMVRQLLPTQGFAAAMRAIGYVQVATFAVALVGLKPRIPARRTGAWVEWKAFAEGEYSLYAAGSFSFFLGLYFAFYYISSFSRDIIGMEYTSSLNLLLVMNGVGIPGRLLPNHLADRFGTINMLIPSAGLAGICVFCWMAVNSTSGLYVWCCFYGMLAGGIQSLFPAGASSLTTDLRKSGVRMGMLFTIVSFATLAGPPIAGAIITAGGGSYYGAQAFAGASLLLGMVLMVAARVVKVRRLRRDGELTKSGWKVKV
ncbi:major facilitator superfamily domain-containing protein [Dichotomopilus funicola]|uniref:Major facilitator superfamily domain-containing protein n=1 Tax=Dichotomopilus funicola TaxID=1934379 RepID=A0AAN6UXB0_9PEZI|nr:major facilitator superfamily domain-containing protein [Dichotomopilus funicola]